MPDSPTQDNRSGRLATPLGKDKLLLTRFDGTEAIGEMFEIKVEAVSTDAGIDFSSVLGVNSSIHLDTIDNAGRDFSGVVTQAKSLGKRGDFYAYSLTLRPWLWLLSLHLRLQNLRQHDAAGDHQAGLPGPQFHTT